MPHPDEGTIHAWLDGELSLEEGAALEEHLGTCDECVAHVAEARGLIAGSARIMGILDDVPSNVVPATGARASGMTSLGEMLTASTGEGLSVQPVTAPDIAPVTTVGARSGPWWMSNQVRAAAAVVLVVGGVLISWGRLNKGEVALKDSVNATPEFLAAQADTLGIPTPSVASAPAAPSVGAGTDARVSNPATQTATGSGMSVGSVAGAATSPTETKLAAVTPPTARPDSAARVARAEQAVAREGATKAERDRALVANAARKDAVPADTARSPQLLAQRATVLAEEQRRQTALAGARISPPVEARAKQAAPTEQKVARDAATSTAEVGRAAGVAAPSARAAAPSAVPSAPTTGDVLRHPYAGCYTIQSASWSPALSTAELAAIPTSFELDTLTATGGPSSGRGLVHPRPESVRAQYEAMFWQPDAGGRATVTLRGARGSLTLALGAGGTQGMALFSRSGGATSRSMITLSRAACR